MSLFNIFTNKSNARPTSSMANEFSKSHCQCKQQDLDLSELTWMDTSTYKKSKKVLQQSSEIVIKAQFANDKQKDLFN